MDRRDILEVVGGLAVGGVTGYFVHDVLAPKGGMLPAAFATAATKLRLFDFQTATNLVGPVVYGGGSEPNGWTYYTVGYGLSGGVRLPDDVIVQLARNTAGATYTNANFVKLADDQVDVYLSGAFSFTLPRHADAPQKTLYNAFAWVQIVD